MVSLISFIISLTLWRLIAVAIWIDDRGPIFIFRNASGEGAYLLI